MILLKILLWNLLFSWLAMKALSPWCDSTEKDPFVLIRARALLAVRLLLGVACALATSFMGGRLLNLYLESDSDAKDLAGKLLLFSAFFAGMIQGWTLNSPRFPSFVSEKLRHFIGIAIAFALLMSGWTLPWPLEPLAIWLHRL